MSTKPLELVRGLGPWAAVAIVVGTMIGTGVFLKPAEMAREAGTLWLVYAAWMVGGLLSLFGALSYAELGAAIPVAGGEFAYIKRGMGPAWGFLYGWMHSVVGRPTSIASISAGLLLFLGFLRPEVATPIFTLNIPLPFQAEPYRFVFTWAQPLAVAAIALVTFVNYLGVKLAGQIQVVLTLIKVASVLAVVVFGFALADGGGVVLGGPLLPEKAAGATLTGFFVALAAALWAYDGWNNINLVGSEVKEPQKNIPRSLVGGVLLVGGVYLLMNAVCFYVLPFDAVARSPHVASDAVEAFAGRNAALWITVAMVISALGTLNSSILSGARVPYAMARDRVFFPIAAGIHPNFRTPGGALFLQAVLASILALSGTFDELTSLFIFAQWIFYALTIVALIRLRRVAPELARPYRTWGYPLVPALFLLGASGLTISLWMQQPYRSTAGLVLILLGLPFYRHWRRKYGVQ